jgi:tetratricopeptide (TPR) repeat protein
MTSTLPNPVVSRRRLLGLLIVLLSLCAAGAAGGWFWYRRAVPMPPPMPDLEGVDPVVASVLTKERQAVLAAPRAAAAWGRFGEVLEVFNYRKDAVLCFAEAERLDPRQPRWPYHQGVLLLWDNAESALPHLRRAVELSDDPQDAGPTSPTYAMRLRLCETLLAQGHLDEAEDGFRRLRDREEQHPRVHLGLGRLAMQRQQWKEALPHLQQAAADRRTARGAAIALAELHQRLGDETAATQARTQLERLPADPPLPDPILAEIQRFNTGKRFRLMQADRLFKQGQAGEAIALYSRVVQDYPDSEEAWFSLGQALYRAHDFANAERILQKTVVLAPRFAEAHNYLGLARLALGQRETAAAAFRKAIAFKPDFALAYSNLGRCLLQQQDTAAALDAFRAAVRCKPNYAAAHTELAELLHQTQRDAEALDEVGQALQLNPSDERAKQLREKLEPKRPAAPTIPKDGVDS